MGVVDGEEELVGRGVGGVVAIGGEIMDLEKQQTVVWQSQSYLRCRSSACRHSAAYRQEPDYEGHAATCHNSCFTLRTPDIATDESRHSLSSRHQVPPSLYVSI